MLIVKNKKSFKNGIVYALQCKDGALIETTDTFLPFYTKNAINEKTNCLHSDILGDRTERWMIGVSVMSGCPVRCKFCATGQFKKYRNLTVDEIINQVLFILQESKTNPENSKEFKINYTRMGEPFLNLDNVKKAISEISKLYPNTHHYVSTIGIKDQDYSWIKGNITLQISLHATDATKRDWLIPFKNKASLEELGKITTESNLKTTLNLTLVDEKDFDIEKLKALFDPTKFFIKLSPINPNPISDSHDLGLGVINQENII